MNVEQELIDQMEKRRYRKIKKSGEYIELNVLIGSEPEDTDDSGSRKPVVSICMHGCNREDVACLHSILKNVIESLEEDFPVECMLSEAMLQTKNLGTTTIKYPADEDEEDDD